MRSHRVYIAGGWLRMPALSGYLCNDTFTTLPFRYIVSAHVHPDDEAHDNYREALRWGVRGVRVLTAAT